MSSVFFAPVAWNTPSADVSASPIEFDGESISLKILDPVVKVPTGIVKSRYARPTESVVISPPSVPPDGPQLLATSTPSKNGYTLVFGLRLDASIEIVFDLINGAILASTILLLIFLSRAFEAEVSVSPNLVFLCAVVSADDVTNEVFVSVSGVMTSTLFLILGDSRNLLPAL